MASLETKQATLEQLHANAPSRKGTGQKEDFTKEANGKYKKGKGDRGKHAGTLDDAERQTESEEETGSLEFGALVTTYHLNAGDDPTEAIRGVEKYDEGGHVTFNLDTGGRDGVPFELCCKQT